MKHNSGIIVIDSGSDILLLFAGWLLKNRPRVQPMHAFLQIACRNMNHGAHGGICSLELYHSIYQILLVYSLSNGGYTVLVMAGDVVQAQT